MKKLLISSFILAIVGFAAYAASPRVDRVGGPMSSGDSNSVAGTMVVSKSPSNEYAIIDLSVSQASATLTNVSYGITFTATPTVISGYSQKFNGSNSVAGVLSTPTVSLMSVSNSLTTDTLTKFLIYGIKRVGYVQP